ncbi:MAG: DUF4147 domain-containing protein [Thermoplasmatales archaeon]
MHLFSNINNFRVSPIRETILNALDFSFTVNSPRERVINFLRGLGDVGKGKVVIIGFGKAAVEMFKGAREYFGDRVWRSVVIAPEYEINKSESNVLYGGHPLPTTESIMSSLRLLESLKGLSEDDLVVALISGGGSSLFEVLRSGCNLDDFNSLISCLMRNGASISEINAIRYICSEVKGGGLLKYTFPASVLGLIISDVPGDDVNTVASGPTGSTPTTASINAVIRKYDRVCKFPSFPDSRDFPRSPCKNYIILKNSDFVEAIVTYLTNRGEIAVNIGSGIQDSTQAVAQEILRRARNEFKKSKRGLFMVGGGETSTVRVGNAKGGRNLELCLRVLTLIEDGEKVYFGSFGTDGIDGSSDAMGALVDNETLSILGREKIEDFLSRSESLSPLLESHDVLFTGPTGTNVSDIFIIYYTRE